MTKYYTSIASFEVAMLLKDLGYSKTWGYQYDKSGELVDPAAPGGIEGVCEAPSYAEVFDWLLDKGLCISVYALDSSDGILWNSQLTDVTNDKFDGSFGYRETFARAADATILKAIEILKTVKDETL